MGPRSAPHRVSPHSEPRRVAAHAFVSHCRAWCVLLSRYRERAIVTIESSMCTCGYAHARADENVPAPREPREAPRQTAHAHTDERPRTA
eukprot:scaffold62279_cov63-Phaeocystis_antarctica.AAC.2